MFKNQVSGFTIQQIKVFLFYQKFFGKKVKVNLQDWVGGLNTGSDIMNFALKRDKDNDKKIEIP